MTEFRYSRTLRGAGLSYEEQGRIYFFLVNIRRCGSVKQRKGLAIICRRVAGDDWRALYKFLTDAGCNHSAIMMQFYVPAAKLFLWKRQVFVLLHEVLM